MKVNHGDSAAPVFNDGRIIGFIDKFLTTQEGGNSGETVLVPIWEVIELLSDQHRSRCADGTDGGERLRAVD
jgi:hypothetical protein